MSSQKPVAGGCSIAQWNPMEPELVALKIVDGAADHAFERVVASLRAILGDVEAHHVGSTAIHGSLSKGDLDIQLRVDAVDFAEMKRKLSVAYRENRGGFWSEVGASFKDDGEDPPLGVHLTVRGGTDDIQWRHTALLRERPELRQAYDELKRPFDGGDMDRYRRAKADFWERLEATEPEL